MGPDKVLIVETVRGSDSTRALEEQLRKDTYDLSEDQSSKSARQRNPIASQAKATKRKATGRRRAESSEISPDDDDSTVSESE